MRILEHGILEGTDAIITRKVMCPFPATPAKVRAGFARLGQVDFLPLILANVTDIHFPGQPIKTESPGVTQTKMQNFITAINRTGEGITGRDAVITDQAAQFGVLRRDTVNIDPQELSFQAVQVLGMSEKVIGVAAITAGDVEIAIGAKMKITAVVVTRILFKFQQRESRGLIGNIGVTCRYCVAGHNRTIQAGFRFTGVINVKIPVQAAIIGVECQSQEALLVASTVNFAGDVEERRSQQGVGRKIINPDDALLLDDKQAAGTIAGICDGNRVGQVICQLCYTQMVEDRRNGKINGQNGYRVIQVFAAGHAACILDRYFVTPENPAKIIGGFSHPALHVGDKRWGAGKGHCFRFTGPEWGAC